MKIYAKKGVPNFQEKKLIKSLTDYFTSNPDKATGFDVPENLEQLKAQHDKYLVETADIISETTTEKPEMTHEEFRKGMEETVVQDELFPQTDPMNRSQPKIRDYVLDDGFDSNPNKKEEPKSTYDEPKNFKDSFDIPDDSIQSDKKKENHNPFNSPPPPKKEAGPADPDAKAKKKSRKKFTRHAVNAVCALAGKGIVWYATKDITDAALAKAIAGDELSEASLRLLVWLDNGTQGEVKTFFQQCIGDAQDLAHFTQEEKDDLIEALDDFLDYKKIEINPGVELIAVGLGILLDRALKAVIIRAKSNSILDQLKDMHKNTYDTSHRDPAAEPEQEANTENPAEQETQLEKTEA